MPGENGLDQLAAHAVVINNQDLGHSPVSGTESVG
jgi:hypothetical protein